MMKPSELVWYFSVTEWSIFCSAIDQVYNEEKPTTMLDPTYPGQVADIKPVIRPVRFQVFSVIRTPDVFRARVFFPKAKEFVWVDCDKLRDERRKKKVA